jgi:hypothetical protein
MDGQISIVWRKGNLRFFLQLSPNTGRVCALHCFPPAFDVELCILEQPVYGATAAQVFRAFLRFRSVTSKVNISSSVVVPYVLDDPDPSFFYKSGSFHQQAEKVRKTLISGIFLLLSLKTDVKVPSKSNKQKNLEQKVFCWHLVSHWRQKKDPNRNSAVWIRGSGSVPKNHGSTTLILSEFYF